MVDSVASLFCNQNDTTEWTIVVDDSCPVVKKLGWLLRNWDRERFFRYVGTGTADGATQELLAKLEESPWSLMLIDSDGQSWHGPEAIPFILKHLPSGKIAAVTYTIPGTMWLTRQLYYMVSRNRHILSERQMDRRTA